MPEIHFPRTRDVHVLFASMPAAFKSDVRKGIDVLAEIPSGDFAELLSFILASFEGSPDVKAVANRWTLSQDDAQSLVSATAAMVALWNAPDQPPGKDQLLAAAVDAGVVQDTKVDVLARLVDALAPTREEFLRARTASRILPSLTNWATTIDLRVRREGGRPVDVVPVLLFYLGTDTDEELSGQMSKRRLQSLIRQQQEALSELEEAESAARGLFQ